MPIEYIDRPPRIQPELPLAEVEIPQPPDEDTRGVQDLGSLLIPLITIIGFVFVSGSGNALFIIPIGLTMILSVVWTLSSSRRELKEIEAKKRAYAELLAEKRQEMSRAQNAQRLFYRHNYPDVQTLYEIAARKETSRFGSRLWERRTSDSDFGVIRLGIGTRPSTVVYKLSQSGSPLDETPLCKDAGKLAQDSEILTDVPITIPLRPYVKDQNEEEESSDDKNPPGSKAIAARHSLGIFGKNPTNTADFARAILAHFATFHSPIDTRLYVIGQPRAQESWRWTEWLPHCNVRDIGIDDTYEASQPESFDQLCFSSNKGEVTEFWMRLKRELDQRQIRLQESDDDATKKGPSACTNSLNCDTFRTAMLASFKEIWGLLGSLF